MERVGQDAAARRRKEFGGWLSGLSEKAGYKTQQEFADACGFSRVQVARWMAGMSRPKEENIPAIAEALKGVATKFDLYSCAGYAVPDDVPAPDDRQELDRIYQIVPPNKRPGFLRTARTMAETLSAA